MSHHRNRNSIIHSKLPFAKGICDRSQESRVVILSANDTCFFHDYLPLLEDYGGDLISVLGKSQVQATKIHAAFYGRRLVYGA